MGGPNTFQGINRPLAVAAFTDGDGVEWLQKGSANLPLLAPNIAPVAGGNAGVATLGSTFIGLYVGSGLPTITAVKGSLYIRTDGSSATTRLYINTDGATAWTSVTTAT